MIGQVAVSIKLDTLIFLTPRSVSSYEEEKWAFNYLRSEGFRVLVFDLTELLNKNINSSELVSRPLQGDFIYRINSYHEFERLVNLFANQSIFVDYLVAHSNVTLSEERVFRILKKYDARYIFLSSGAMPHPVHLKTNISYKLKIFRSKIVKAINNPYFLVNYVASKVILLLTRYSLFYPLPTLIFGGESSTLKQFIKARKIDKKSVVPINCFDYDNAVSYARKLGDEILISENYCVFLDEAATHHSDFALLNIEPAETEAYFSAMNQFFNFIEKSMGLKVIIAAHPRSNYESMPDLFGGRDVIKGKTVELVAKSKLVLMHVSTAVSYAVLFEKPVILLKIPGMKPNGQLNLSVEAMGVSIGSKPIDLDVDEVTASDLRRECDFQKYLDYKNFYIKTEGADELPEWEIVANTLAKIYNTTASNG